jgi:hypothetical protein
VLRVDPQGSRSVKAEIRFATIAKLNCRAPRWSSSLAFHLKDKPIVGPDFDVVILKEPLGAHHGFPIVSADEGFKLDAPAVIRDAA